LEAFGNALEMQDRSLPSFSLPGRLAQHRILMTPDVVVLGSGSDEDIQLKSDEDGVIVTETKRSSSIKSQYHTISLETTAPSLPEQTSSDLFIVHQVNSSYFQDSYLIS
jgi:hypothetical protein